MEEAGGSGKRKAHGRKTSRAAISFAARSPVRSTEAGTAIRTERGAAGEQSRHQPFVSAAAPIGLVDCIYDIPTGKSVSPEDIGLVEMTRSAIIGDGEPELEELDDPARIPPGRGV